MSCVLNIDRYLIPNDIINTLCNIYMYIGKNETYEKTVGSDIIRIVEQTIERDCYFFAKILKLDISDSRMRLIITKNSEPRTKDEKTLFYIKDILKNFQFNHMQITTQSNDLNNIINFVYPDLNIKYVLEQNEGSKTYLKSQSMRSKRITIDEINEEVQKNISKEKVEKIFLYMHYFIDFYNINPFTFNNQTASFLLLYLLILKSNLYAYKFVSLYEQIYMDFENFELELKNASFNWKEGFSQSLGFVRYMTRLFLKSYERTNEIVKEYEFDSNLNKTNNIENTVAKLPTIFTKEEIRLVHPYVSESTINRTLSKLRDEKQIKPLGKGRSAKWIKIK